MPRPQSQDNAPAQSHGTCLRVKPEPFFRDSFILFRRDDAPFIWTPPASYIRYTPPEPDRGCCYGASYAADDLLEHVREALRGGDDLAARCALHTLRGLAEVVLAKLSGELLQ